MSQVLELGSGAGYFGIGLLKSNLNVSQYTFTDAHYNVLNTLMANVEINLKSGGDVDNNCMKQWLETGPPQRVDRSKIERTLVTFPIDHERVAFVRYLDWLQCTDEFIDALDYNVIVGSDLTYTLSMLLPLAQLIRRLLSKKKAAFGNEIAAYIACTHRDADTVNAFLRHSAEVGLSCTAVIKSSFGPNDGLTITHEPLRPVTIYKFGYSEP